MTCSTRTATLRIAALSAAWLLQAPAQAGLVTGSWDPEFGAALPGLSWAVHAELLVPDACTNLGGTQAIAPGGPCGGATVRGVFLRLFDTSFTPPDWSDPGAYFSVSTSMLSYGVCDTAVSGDPAYAGRCNNNFGNYFNLSALRIEDGSVAGLQTSVAATFGTVVSTQPWPPSAQGNSFTLDFTLNGPQLTCTTCPGGPVPSQLDGLRQFLITYTSDDTSTPKFTDAAGNALGVRLDQRGQVLGRSTSITGPLQQVPEPGSLVLAASALAALAAAALVRRRR